MARSLRTGDQALVRELNRSIILNQLRAGAPSSRAGLAVITGLNKTTVSRLVDELIADGFVREIGHSASVGGRPGVLLEVDSDAGYIIGAEIGVGYLNVVVADFRATVGWRRHVPFDAAEDQRGVVHKLAGLLREAGGQAARSGKRLFGAGITVPGLVDVASGMLLYEPNMGWRDLPLRQLLEVELDLPIYTDNDANAAALGERYFGAAQYVDNFVYVVGNVGLGTGLVIGGHLYQGASGFAGEAGHTTIDPEGPLCRCGNRGCWERLASQRALIERIENAIRAGEHSLIEETVKGDVRGITVQTVLDAAKSGDEVCRRALEETGMYLGIGFANLVNVFNPSLVALGGALSLGHEFLIPIARSVVSERAMRGPREVTQIVVSAFKADACVMGGVALVMHDILSRPHLGPFPLVRRNAVPAAEEPSQPAGEHLTPLPTEGGMIST